MTNTEVKKIVGSAFNFNDFGYTGDYRTVKTKVTMTFQRFYYSGGEEREYHLFDIAVFID